MSIVSRRKEAVAVELAARTPNTHDPSVCQLAILEWRERASVAIQCANFAIQDAAALRVRVAELELSVKELRAALNGDDEDDPDPDDGVRAPLLRAA